MSFRRKQFGGVFKLVDVQEFTLTPGSISQGNATVETATWDDLVPEDFVMVDLVSASGTDTSIHITGRCQVADTLQVVFSNAGGSPEDPGTVVVRGIALRSIRI